MQIRPPSTVPLSTPKQTPTTGTNFHETLASKAKQTEAASSLWTQDLGRLSQDMKAGKISQQEACQQFVELVVAKGLDLSRFSSNPKAIQQAVTEVLGADPLFIPRLETQLKKLS